MPALPAFGAFRAPATHNFAFKGLWHCNWLQAFEVGIDPTHPSFLHRYLRDDALDASGRKEFGRQFRAASVGRLLAQAIDTVAAGGVPPMVLTAAAATASTGPHTMDCLTSAAPLSTAVPAQPGQSLMRAATDAGVAGIAGDCGGTCSCANCHVSVEPAWLARLPPPGLEEAAMLEMTAAPREPGSRLACQIVLDTGLDGLRARLPLSQC